MVQLFVGAGSRGDVQPLIALAIRARDEGHRVAVCGAPDFENLVTRFGLEFRPVGLPAREFLSGEAKDLATRGAFHTLKRFNQAIDSQMRAQFTMLHAASKDAEVIFGGGVAFTAPSIAEARGIPYRYVAYCPTALRSTEYAPIVVPWQGLPRLANRALWKVLGNLYDRLVGRPLNDLRAELDLAPTRNVLANIYGSHVLLTADPQLGPAPSDAPMHIVGSAFEALSDNTPLDARTEAFLANGEKPVFIGFGSMPDDDPTRTTTLLASAIKRTGVRAIVSRGWAELGANLDDKKILVLDEAPHAALFKRVAAVVHHGGAGTTHTAARAGVPQVIVVHLMDQGYWAARVRALGLGPRALARKTLSASGLADALTTATKDPRFATTAAAFARHMPHPEKFNSLRQSLQLD